MYTIGEFSKLTWITVKALRHYDEVGILPPAAVDPGSGYRFYDEDQIQTAALIRKLRRFEFPLKSIKVILESEPVEVLPILDDQIDRLLRNQKELAFTIRELQNFKNQYQENPMSINEENTTFTIESSPEIGVLATRQTTGIDQIGAMYSKLFEEAARHGITPNGVTGIRYYDDEFDRENSDMEVFIGVDRPNYVIPSTQCLKAVHRGPYSTLEDTYAALMQEISKQDYKINGAPFEIYRVNQFNSPDPSDWITDIYFPIA